MRGCGQGGIFGVRVHVSLAKLTAIEPRKAKRRYLLTLQVSRYCLLTLQYRHRTHRSLPINQSVIRIDGMPQSIQTSRRRSSSVVLMPGQRCRWWADGNLHWVDVSCLLGVCLNYLSQWIYFFTSLSAQLYRGNITTKESPKPGYALLLFRMASRVLYCTRYHRQHCTLQIFEHFEALCLNYVSVVISLLNS